MLAVGLDGLWRSKTGDGDLLFVVALVLCSLELARKSGGVVADDQVDIWISVENCLTNGDCLLCVLVGVVVLVDVLPLRILLLDDLLCSYLPGVLVGNGCLGVVPDVGDLVLLWVLAALLEARNAHVNKHLTKNLWSTLRNHEGTVLWVSVGVPSGNYDTSGGCLLQCVGNALCINGGDADCVYAVSNCLVDDGNLSGNGCGCVADVVNGEAPLLGLVLCALVCGLEECVAGDLRNKCYGLTLDVSATLGLLGLFLLLATTIIAACQSEASANCGDTSGTNKTTTSNLLHR